MRPIANRMGPKDQPAGRETFTTVTSASDSITACRVEIGVAAREKLPRRAAGIGVRDGGAQQITGL